MRTRAKTLSGLGILWLIFSHTSATASQPHDVNNTQNERLRQIKSLRLAKNLWQIDRTPETMEKIHKLLPLPGGSLCHAISIHHIVLNFINVHDYIRVPLPDSRELYVQQVRRTESRYGIVQWSGTVLAHDDLIFSLFFNPVHKTYTSHISLGAQDAWAVRPVGDLTVICNSH